MKKRPLTEPTVADTVAAAVAAAVAGNIHHPQDSDYDAVTAAAVAASAEARDIYEQQPDDHDPLLHEPEEQEDPPPNEVDEDIHMAGFSEIQQGAYHGHDSTDTNDHHPDVPSDLSHYVEQMAADPTATAAAEQASMHYTTTATATQEDDHHQGQEGISEHEVGQQELLEQENQEDENVPLLPTDLTTHHESHGDIHHSTHHHYQQQQQQHMDSLGHVLHHHHHGDSIQDGTTMEHLTDHPAASMSLVDSVPPLIKRKDKSLGVLCVNFMHRYDQMKVESPHEIPEVSIDEAASKLSVEKRRIYDIINILEAIEVVSRKCKNTYNWHGMDGLEEVFRRLQKEAVMMYPEDAAMFGLVEERHNIAAMEMAHVMHHVDAGEVMEDAVADTVAAMSEGDFMQEEAQEHDNHSHHVTEDIQHHLEQDPNDSMGGQEEEIPMPEAKRQRISSDFKYHKKHDPTIRASTMKENSLGRLSQKFIQYFLAGHEFVELNIATDKILGISDEELLNEDAMNGDIEKAKKQAAKLIKTKSRRLYDIANVMVSIGLIQKVNHAGALTAAIGAKSTRSSFQWIYPLSAKDLWEGRKFEDDPENPHSMHHVMSGGEHELHHMEHDEHVVVDDSGHHHHVLDVPAPMPIHSESEEHLKYESV